MPGEPKRGRAKGVRGVVRGERTALAVDAPRVNGYEPPSLCAQERGALRDSYVGTRRLEVEGRRGRRRTEFALAGSRSRVTPAGPEPHTRCTNELRATSPAYRWRASCHRVLESSPGSVFAVVVFVRRCRFALKLYRDQRRIRAIFEWVDFCPITAPLHKGRVGVGLQRERECEGVCTSVHALEEHRRSREGKAQGLRMSRLEYMSSWARSYVL